MERGPGSDVLFADRPRGVAREAGPVGDVPGDRLLGERVLDEGVPDRGEAPPRWVRLTGRSLLGLQLVAMVVFSIVQYSRFGLGNDFANYSQAWWAVGHGNLDPYSTGFGIAFWWDNAEFILWPLVPIPFT